ncbi:MAG: UDP-N-acetylglucosamine--N-acetylmuramyl-(pentapeptide) pyrophosphoryl-undecaprenol N-acetylglucosamine transferase [Phycisphaeraceae bacterium]|nr:UDP-N-acetylglucosamine--N-acetylmuramyl-(pentapeptide) pyrophosphoryl-undecaprenol N-acetylglucosamine transferase [Phycisphaeraceae bacterium]
MNTDDLPTFLLAGGGTGGHVFPNIAVAEALARDQVAAEVGLLVSTRPSDARWANRLPELPPLTLDVEAIPARPFSARPWHWPGFYMDWRAGRKRVRERLEGSRVQAVVATGGFVSGPVIAEASAAGVTTALVDLDAAAGRASRWLRSRVDCVFSAAPDAPEDAVPIGVPLREAARAEVDPATARRELGLKPDRSTLLVIGGSQGAASINETIMHLLAADRWPDALADWQLLHLCGSDHVRQMEDVLEVSPVAGRVIGFCDRPGLAWAAADLAVSRAGASAVAEAWASETPTIFLPYPWHRDQHQRLNAQPLVEAEAAVVMDDRGRGDANASDLVSHLAQLAGDTARRERMAAWMREHPRPDGAAVIAAWLRERLSGS